MGNQVNKLNKKLDDLLFKVYSYLTQEDSLSDSSIDLTTSSENKNEEIVEFQQMKNSEQSDSDKYNDQTLYTAKSNIENSNSNSQLNINGKRRAKSFIMSDKKSNKKICANKENYQYI